MLGGIYTFGEKVELERVSPKSFLAFDALRVSPFSRWW